MNTLKQLPEEGQKAIARSLGFMGNVKDFPRFMMANKKVADEYAKMENVFQQQQQQRKPAGMAEGGQVENRDSIGDVSADMLEGDNLPEGAEIQPTYIDPTVGNVAEGTGQVSGTSGVNTTLAGTYTTETPQQKNYTFVDPTKVSDQVNTALQNVQGAQGQVSDQALVQGQTQNQSSVSNLNAAQGTAHVTNNQITRELQDGELVQPTFNAEKAAKFSEQIQAAEATPSEQATVRGQLSELMKDFEGGNTPSWASGAMRKVAEQMSARGLSSSSIAGQALLQTAMESALPVAMADAGTFAKFEAQNLSNRQQRAMLAAEQRANFIGQEFNQAFQARVINATKISDIANMNFNADQQIQLENSRAANTMNLQNLNNRQALVMAEAAALANLDMANLSNRQQAAVMNAQSFLQMDMANLSNRQQADMFVAQQQIQALFTDQAADNAMKQFNATSQNQVDQFFASLTQTANQFNASQLNAQEQFNAGQVNTIERFNAEIDNQRDQFNAQNQLVIAQSNANWRRQIATADTAATNRANELNAQNILGISQNAYNNLWQYYGDTMEWAWTSAENERSRVVQMAIAQLQADASANIQTMKNDYQSSAAFGQLIGKFITGSLFGGF